MSKAATAAIDTTDIKTRAILHTLRPMSAQDEAAGDMPTMITRGEGVHIFDAQIAAQFGHQFGP